MLAANHHASVPTVRLAGEPGAAWNQLADRISGSRLAHAAEWFAIVRRAYGHEPLYLAAEDDRDAGILPAFVVRRPFFGTIVTSMPFLDSGGPCSTSPAVARALIDRLIVEARALGAAAVDLRSPERIAIESQPSERKVNMTLPLDVEPDRLWDRLDKDTRYQVRKARRSGLSASVERADQLDAFYAIFAARMRDLGSPVHARGFLQTILEAFGHRARIVLVRRGATVIGGLVALAFKERLVVPWAACLKEHFPLCPNMLLYWETIRGACVDGFRCFDFGRSTRESGTYRFKAQWGAQEEPLFWYTIPLNGTTSLRGQRASLIASLWRHTPPRVADALGPRIRRYLIQ